MTERSFPAKFRGICKECGGLIEPGQPIFWTRARGARHADWVNDCAEVDDTDDDPRGIYTSDPEPYEESVDVDWSWSDAAEAEADAYLSQWD